MNFCGIVCEFNPFHNGHEYIINKAKQMTGDEIICLMSGNFVQRGEPAIQEKYSRAKNAIYAGANVVLELPTIYACSNAENFAYGAIKIFKSLNVKHLAFGVESANLEILQKIAKIKFENSITFQNAFKNEIENGINYNTALKRAISKQIPGSQVAKILDSPNNILAIEYLTAILKLNAKIIPVPIERIDNGYYSNVSKNQYLGASSIREKIINNSDVSKFIPSYAKITNFLNLDCISKFESLLLYNIRTTSPKTLSKCYDYNEGIEYRIRKKADTNSSLDKLVSQIQTPRYRATRVKKLILYPILNITKSTVSLAQKAKPVSKVLAINKNEKCLLNTHNKHKINLIVTNADYNNLSKSQQKIIDIDLNASNLYNLVIGNQNNNDKKTGVLFL